MVKARIVLWYLVFIGFAVNYMIHINLNITIVEMVAERQVNSTQMFRGNWFQYENIFVKSDYKTARSAADGRFNWNEYEQSLVLGAFFWVHWITQIPGGILAKKYGTKLIFGLANAIGCWLCCLVPPAAHYNYKMLILVRVIQGLITGMAWPAMHVLTAKWIPPNERSKFVTAYLGGSVGIAVFYPLFGYIMYWSSWELVYYICGAIGTLWWLAWLIFVYDSPAQHPRISAKELQYIEKSVEESLQNSAQHTQIPWKAILTSRAVWMNIIAQWGAFWGLFTLMTQAPTYFRVIHNWNIRTTGILSGLPHLMRMVFALGFSALADHLLKTKKMNYTNLRKLATSTCCIMKGIMVLALAFFGYDASAAVILVTLATMFHGALSSGPLASIIDMSPNYAGVVLGISTMIAVLPGFLSSYTVGILTLGNQSFESWRNVFLICSAMLIGSGILYDCFAESTLQSWNTPAPAVEPVNEKTAQKANHDKTSALEINSHQLSSNRQRF